MMGYLTNTHIKNKLRCEYAARESGMNVVFMSHPMPADYYDPDFEGYDPCQLMGKYGSIYTHEGFVDHSNFWRAWDTFPS